VVCYLIHLAYAEAILGLFPPQPRVTNEVCLPKKINRQG
jgi:hypothetical protein